MISFCFLLNFWRNLLKFSNAHAVITLGCILIWFNCNLSICYLSVLICLIDKTLDSQKMKFRKWDSRHRKGKTEKDQNLDSQKERKFRKLDSRHRKKSSNRTAVKVKITRWESFYFHAVENTKYITTLKNHTCVIDFLTWLTYFSNQHKMSNKCHAVLTMSEIQ